MPTTRHFACVLALLLTIVPLRAWAQCADGDGDGVCNEVDPCTSGVTVHNPLLRLRKVTNDEWATRFYFVGTLDLPIDSAIDPVSDGIRLVVTSTTQDAPPARTETIDVTLPPGSFDSQTRVGWSVGSPGTYLYRDAHGMNSHILRALVKRLDSGEVKVLFFGQNGLYPLPNHLPGGTIAAAVMVEPQAVPGPCGDVTLTECWYRNQGRKLLCD
jgi:hypothetical protein